MTGFALLDLTSVFVFALTGALVASRAQLDIVGFVFLGVLTAVGGGTVRDLLLNRDPVFWIGSPSYLAVAMAAAVLVYLTAHLVDSRKTWIVWLDAIALSVAVAVGFGTTQTLGYSAPIIVVMSIVTGTLGGLMRDVVANEVPLVLSQGEIYATACFSGALAGVVLLWMGAPLSIGMSAAAVLTFVLRAGSIAFGWKLPVYKARPPKV